MPPRGKGKNSKPVVNNAAPRPVLPLSALPDSGLPPAEVIAAFDGITASATAAGGAAVRELRRHYVAVADPAVPIDTEMIEARRDIKGYNSGWMRPALTSADGPKRPRTAEDDILPAMRRARDALQRQVREAEAELLIRGRLARAVAALAALPKAATGLNPKNAAHTAALAHFTDSDCVRFVHCVEHRTAFELASGRHHITDVVLDGALRVVSIASNPGPETFTCQLSPASVAGPALENRERYAWAEGAPMKGTAARKILSEAASPLAALPPKALELLCRVVSTPWPMCDFLGWGDMPELRETMVGPALPQLLFAGMPTDGHCGAAVDDE